MDKEMISLHQLGEFIQALNLMDDRSNVHFRANVTFEMEDHRKELDMEVWIIIRDGIRNGVVQLIDSNIEERLYPTNHVAIWQDYEFVNNRSLQIKGKHPRNGEYIVTITPIR